MSSWMVKSFPDVLLKTRQHEFKIKEQDAKIIEHDKQLEEVESQVAFIKTIITNTKKSFFEKYGVQPCRICVVTPLLFFLTKYYFS